MAHFFCVYIKEVHTEDEWQSRRNLEEQVIYRQPQTLEERAAMAKTCVLNLDLAMPMLLDTMSNDVDSLYAGLPERLYVLDSSGVVTYRSEFGPSGFDADSWEKALSALL